MSNLPSAGQLLHLAAAIRRHEIMRMNCRDFVYETGLSVRPLR